MKKRLLAILIAGLSVISMTACGNAGDSVPTNNNTQAADDGASAQHTIAVVLKTLNSDYWNCVASGVRQAEKDFGCKVELNGPPSEVSYDEQINMIETSLNNSSVEAIVIAPLQPESTANVVQNAEIPVIAVDTTFESDKLLSYVGVSNYDAAYALGEYASEQLAPNSNILLLAGTQGDITSADRMAGYTDSLEAAGHTILEMQYTDTAPDKTATIMEGAVQKYGADINAVFCLSDDVAVSAATIVQQSGLSDPIIVYGFGGISGAEPVKEGMLAATVSINPYEMGYNCIAKAIDAVEGKTIDPFYPTTPEIIDISNVDDFLIQLDEWTS